MTDYENILVSAVRYALGRRTYIVGLTCDYIANIAGTLSEHCRSVMIQDIKALEWLGCGAHCEKYWMKLLNKLEEK